MNRRILAIVFFCIAGLLTLIALGAFWQGATRWMGVSHLYTWQLGNFNLRPDSDAGKAATAWQPNTAACGLASIRINNAEAVSELDDLIKRIPNKSGSERALVEATRAMCQMINKQAPDRLAELSGPDADLLRMVDLLSAVRPGQQLVAWPQIAANRVIMQYALERYLNAAWVAGNGVALRETAQRMLYLNPRHPEEKTLRVIDMAGDPSKKGGDFTSVLQANGEPTFIPRFLRGLAQLMPGRRAEIAKAMPSGERTAEDVAAMVLNNKESLSELVDSTLALPTPTPSLLREVFTRSLRANRLDLASKIAPKAGADDQDLMRLAVAVRVGEPTTIVTLSSKLGKDQALLLPKLISLHRDGRIISFHLITSDKSVPEGALSITVNKDQQKDSQIVRVGTLVEFTVPESCTPGSMIDIRINQVPVLSSSFSAIVKGDS